MILKPTGLGSDFVQTVPQKLKTADKNLPLHSFLICHFFPPDFSSCLIFFKSYQSLKTAPNWSTMVSYFTFQTNLPEVRSK